MHIPRHRYYPVTLHVKTVIPYLALANSSIVARGADIGRAFAHGSLGSETESSFASTALAPLGERGKFFGVVRKPTGVHGARLSVSGVWRRSADRGWLPLSRSAVLQLVYEMLAVLPRSIR